MHRFFFEIAYNGSKHSGWQKQPNAITIQEEIELLFHTLFQNKIDIVGCGRTDAGVHASKYFFHADLNTNLSKEDLLYKLNRMSEAHLAFYKIKSVKSDAHARFDAYQRSYNYNLGLEKNPFETNFVLPSRKNFNFHKLNEAASELLLHEAFFPLCKSNSEVKNYNCNLSHSAWEKISETKYVYHVTSNRFLRGMVRLIVGMCINYMNGIIDLKEIKDAMQQQRRFNRDLSVPPNGLFLNQVLYPKEIFIED